MTALSMSILLKCLYYLVESLGSSLASTSDKQIHFAVISGDGVINCFLDSFEIGHVC
jgi:hypothetical protein